MVNKIAGKNYPVIYFAKGYSSADRLNDRLFLFDFNVFPSQQVGVADTVEKIGLECLV
jgi:hypothetical protein